MDEFFNKIRYELASDTEDWDCYRTLFCSLPAEEKLFWSILPKSEIDTAISNLRSRYGDSVIKDLIVKWRMKNG